MLFSQKVILTYPLHHDDHGYPLHHDEHQEEHDGSGDGMITVKLPEII